MFQVPIPAVRVTDLKQVFRLMAEGGRLLSGGTDILVQAKEHPLEIPCLVDISSIPELRRVEETPKKLVIGAAVTVNAVRVHPVVRADFPALAFSTEWFASPQIRNRATLAGNIANASPAGDTVPALYAYDAVVLLRSAKGRREMPLADFIKGVRKTELAEGEIITGIALARRRGGENTGGFIKVGQRKSLAISKVMAAVAATVAPSGAIRQVGIAVGAVATTILRITEAEEMLRGKKLTPDLARRAREITAAAVRPIDDIRSTAHYRRHVSGVIVERTLLGLKRAAD